MFRRPPKHHYSTSSKSPALREGAALELYDVLLIPNTENLDFVIGHLFVAQLYFDKVMHAKDLTSLLGTKEANIYFDPTLVLTFTKNQGYDLY